MNFEAMQMSADLIFADAVQDLTAKTGLPLAEVRKAAICSAAYEALYDFDTGMWKEGPDAFAELVEPYL